VLFVCNLGLTFNQGLTNLLLVGTVKII